MPIIEVSNLTKRYKKAERNAVDDISFSVEEGEFFAFLGPNGAGKTTTISMLTTTLAKTSGTIRIAGFDLDQEPAKVRSKIGVIFQNPSLDLNLTAEENIRMHAVLYGMYPFRPTYNLMPEEYKLQVMELSEVLALKNDIFKPIKGFSGGMKRKLEIIRTLIHSPKVLFLDEPTSGLDPMSRKNLWKYLKDIKERDNITIFLTTHYLDEAEDADRICIVNNGRIVINDTIDTIKSRLVKDYVYLEAEDKTLLEKELKEFGYTYETTKKGGFNVTMENLNAQNFINSISTKLSRINISQPTLEETYLDLIKEENGKS